MTQELTNVIVKHIFHNLGLLEHNNWVQNSLVNPLFLTKEEIEFLDENDEERISVVWACQTIVNNSHFKIMGVKFGFDGSIDSDIAVVIKLEDCPTYGCMANQIEDTIDEALIACLLKEETWIPATTYIQATFLAGMEQLKDLSAKYDKCEEIDELFQELKSFINYYNVMTSEGLTNAGQED